MQIVELKVNVEKSQLAQLEAQVKALENRTITIKVNTAGLTALDNQTLRTIKTQTEAAKVEARLAAQRAKSDAALAKQATAQARVQVAQEKTRQTATRLAIEQEKSARAVNNTATAYSKASKQVSGFQKLMGGSFTQIAAQMAMWQVMGTAISVPIRAMKDALNTMKEVDSQLVVIQKTTNFTNQQMKEIEKQAYKTASAYGQSADSYLESVAAFARAGYKEQSADLAELAIKTQLVGDTTAEVADQFLLSVDKAYKLNGSITELEKVLDGADYINNNYATSLEKIAEGMGIIAPVAEQAHVGVDELMAGIGTITAVTQRSGSEAARALRALFLNIIGDTKTEIEDGATWTAGEIEGLRDVLRQFAPDVVKFAEETKSVINPMEAMRALSQAMKDDVLSEQQLMEMVSDIGGKLRTSQLLALIQNWDMYESMLSDYQRAAGTADKEISFILDSWESKANILKNTWTEFVSNMVETDAIKGVLDGLTKTIEFLDSDLGHAAITAGTFALAFAGLSKAVAAFRATEFVNFIASFASIAAGQGFLTALSQSITMLGEAFAANPALPIMALAADFIFMKKSIDEAYITLDEQKAIVADLKTQYEQLTAAGSEYADLMERVNSADDTASSLTAQERARLAVLEAEVTALENQIAAEEKLAFTKFQAQDKGSYQMENGELVDTGVGDKTERRLEEMNRLYEDGFKKVQEGKMSLSEYRDELQKIISDNADWYSQMKEWEDLGFSDSFTEAQKEAMKLYEIISMLLGLGDKDMPVAKALGDFEEAGNGFTEFANNTVVSAESLRHSFEEAGLGAEEARDAINGLRDDGVVVIDVKNDGAEETLSNLETLGIAVNDADGWHINIDGLETLAGELGLSSGQVDILIQKLSGIDGVSFDGATASIGVVYDSVGALIGLTQNYTGGSPYNATLTAKDNASSVIGGALSLLGQFVSKTITLTATYVTSGTGPGGGTAGSGNAGLHKAKGDINFKGGPAILGDELSPDGSPRPELVIAKTGEVFVAGSYGPVAMNLPAGSRIFTYSETQDILSGEDVTQIPAFAGGRGTRGTGGSGLSGVSLINRYLRGVASRISSSGSSGSSGSSSSGSSRSGSSGSSRSRSRSGGGRSGGGSSGGGTASTTTLENLESELEILKQEYEFLEASNASTDELIAKSKEIQDKLHQINGELANSGGEQKDIINNSTEWWNELEKQRKVEQSKLSLLRKEYDFLEASGASQEELNKKSKEIQEKLHEINESLRQTNGSQEEILENSTAWWEELKKIQEAQISLHEDERDLLESELTLMEHQGKSVAERIAKMRSIQQNLHREAEYLRSIEASQAEINQLSIEWWEIQEKILDTQKDLVGELEAAVNAQLRAEQAKRDKEVKVWQDLIDAAKERRNLQEDQNELEEKNNRIIEARIALQNALNERTVRYYNAATGQWEWAADANSVKTAREELESATKDYAEAVDNQNFEKQIATYQAEIDKINAQYESTESFWQDFLATFDEPLNTIEEVLRDMYANGLLTNEQLELLKQAGFDIEEITAKIYGWLSYQEYLQQNPLGNPVEYLGEVLGDEDFSIENPTFLNYVANHPDTPWSYTDSNGITYYSDGTVSENTGYSPGSFRLNSAADAGRAAAEYAALVAAAARAQKESTSGGTSSSGMGTNTAGANAAKAEAERLKNAMNGSSGNSSSSSSPSSTNSSSSSGSSSNSSSSGTVSKTQSTVSKSTISKTKYTPTTNKKFDSGGILSGLGGIKATPADEVVIPPEVASYMLKPTAPREFRERMAELGYLYGTNKDIPGTLTGILGSRTSNDHYGDVYQYGNITLTEGQARSMTVYDLAQMSRSLSIYRNV